MDETQNTPSNLDPSVVALMHGMKVGEGTNGNYNKIGDNGTSMGIAQWSNDVNGKPQTISQGDLPANFKSMAQQYGFNPSDFSPQNQNKVLYASIANDKKNGLTPEQILSKWNSGSPNAYQNPATSTGTGPVGQYDVSAYVKRSMAAAQQYASQSKGQSTDLAPGVPSLQLSGQGQNQPQTQDKGFLGNLMSGNFGGAAKNAMDFAFPIISDAANDISGQNQKTALQQLGDAGLSALWFVPGLGDGSGLLAHVLEGGAVGYGAGSLSQLSQGKGLGQSLAPNMSNLLGAATGGIASGALSKLSGVLGKNVTQSGALQSLEDNLGSAIGGTKSGARFVSDSASVGFNPAKLLSQSMAIPDVIDGKFNTTEAENIIQKRIGQLGDLRATALDKMGTSIPLEDLRNEALAQVAGLKATGETGSMSAKINKIFDDFKLNYGENLSPSDLEKIKEAQAGASGIYKRTGQIGEQNASSIIGNVSRSKIESLAEQSGFSGMKEYNQYIAQHYNALDALNKINGQVVKGGRLGNMLRGHTIAGISALGANAMGGGFLGTLAAGLGGEGANNIISKIMGDSSFSNPLKDAVLQKIESENPEIVQKLQQMIGQGGSIAPLLQPKASSKLTGLLPSLLTKTAARGGATLGQ